MKAVFLRLRGSFLRFPSFTSWLVQEVLPFGLGLKDLVVYLNGPPALSLSLLLRPAC